MRPNRSRPRRTALAVLAAFGLAAAAVLVPLPASAAETDTWADFDVSGSAGAYSGTVVLPDAFPATTFTSTSRQVTVPSGASTWMAASTPVGEAFGSSRNRPYTNIRPAADNANSPAVTRYAFATPTPTDGWAFVLGDIDADQVTITATGADGSAVPVSQLGFQGGFNYCHRSGGPSCDAAGLSDEPVWTDNGTSGLLDGNAAATDTEGAAAWFRPGVALTSLTMTFRQRNGFPSYQTWFVAQTFAASGVVTLDGAPLPGQTVTVQDGSGRVVGTAVTTASGTWSLPALIASGPYTASITPPAGIAALPDRQFSLIGADADGVDFPFVTPPAPAAADDSEATTQGAPVSIPLLSNDEPGSDDFPLAPSSVRLSAPAGAPAGTVLSADGRSLVIPGEGAYVVDSAGTLTFTPELSFTGAGSAVPYTVLDSRGGGATATVTVTVAAVTPTASPDDWATQQGVATTVTPTANDSAGSPSVPLVLSSIRLLLPSGAPAGSSVSADGRSLTIAGEGGYSVNDAGDVVFQPLPAFTGTAISVPYTIADSNGTVASSAITIQVSAAAAPIASSYDVTTRQGVPISGDVLTRDVASSPSATLDPTSVILLLPADAPAGSSITPDGKSMTIAGEGDYGVDPVTGIITLTPLPTFSGSATAIGYSVTDSTGQSATAEIRVEVMPVTPMASPDEEATRQGEALTLSPAANDDGGDPAIALVPSSVRLALPAIAPAGSTLSADRRRLTIPGEGEYLVGTDGTVTFQPVASFSGVATAVPYTVTDTNGTQAQSLITVTVSATTPVAAADAAMTDQGVALTVDILANDVAGDDSAPLDPTTVRLGVPADGPSGAVLSADGRTLSVPGEGVYTVDATSGTISFAPEPGFTGAASTVPYSVADANGTAADSEFAVSVTPVTPVASPDLAETTRGASVVIDALDNDFDGAATAPIDRTTLRLVLPDGASGTLSADGRTLTLDEVGVFTVDPGTGDMTFDPDTTFTGETPRVPYTVQDANGTFATSFIRVDVEESPAPPATTTPPPSGAAPAPPTGTSPAAPAAGSGSGLASTGVDPAVPALAALAFLLLGAAAVTSARRRSRGQSR